MNEYDRVKNEDSLEIGNKCQFLPNELNWIGFHQDPLVYKTLF